VFFETGILRDERLFARAFVFSSVALHHTDPYIVAERILGTLVQHVSSIIGSLFAIRSTHLYEVPFLNWGIIHCARMLNRIRVGLVVSSCGTGFQFSLNHVYPLCPSVCPHF
jgi:hypothetical protein